MTKKYIIGNLKMYGSISFYDTFFKKIRELSMHKSLDNIEIALCIPYPYLYLAQQILGNSGIYWGSQNVAKDNEGPFTGEVSAKMLKEFDSQFSIIELNFLLPLLKVEILLAACLAFAHRFLFSLSLQTMGPITAWR